MSERGRPGVNGHGHGQADGAGVATRAGTARELPLSPEGFRDQLRALADGYDQGAATFIERRARLPDTLRALATVLREAVTVLGRAGLPAELDRLPSPRPLDKGLVLRIGGTSADRDGDGALLPAEQPAQLRIEVRADARLQIVWVGHALIGELARELHRDEPRAPSELGVLGFKREVVRFLEAALASSYRGA
ncbi:MAG: hypothetical protein H6709_06075 [Kofleriaceae bacterium]|nr:hypothetical protein [Kofleriaceae bacterium]MCB9571641.1 hypothetical protein [Kofleriaceae bacterium]